MDNVITILQKFLFQIHRFRKGRSYGDKKYNSKHASRREFESHLGQMSLGMG